MGRILLSRLRRIVPDPGWLIVFAVAFLFLEGLLRYLEIKNIPIFTILPIRPGYVVLLIASAQYGFRRAVEFHPIWSEGYRTWLGSTPWDSRKPLPMGPVELVWEDGLILGLIILLSATLPLPRAMHLLCAFLLSHLLGLTVTLWLTRIRAIGYMTAFGLGLAVWLWNQPLPCLAASTVVYLVAYEGLRRGLEQFPWAPRKMPDFSDLNRLFASAGPCGWPFDRMLGQVLIKGISRTDAVVCCMLFTCWLFVLTSFFRDPNDRLKILVIPLCIFWFTIPIIRLAIYLDGYIAPITFWGRIRTGRWIIPGFDQVFIIPLFILAIGPLSVYSLRASGLPLDVCMMIGTGLMPLVALIAPPRLRRWRLIGRHRIVPGIPANQSKAKCTICPSRLAMKTTRDADGEPPRLGAVQGILGKLCPQCRRGSVFHSLWKMNENCPVCGLDFDRGDPGYFTGAMYASYAMAIPLLAVVTGIEYLILAGWSLFGLVVLASLICTPLVPWIWQYSRVIWIYFDRYFDPEDEQGEARSDVEGQ